MVLGLILLLCASSAVNGYSATTTTQAISRREFIRSALLSSGVVAGAFLIQPSVARADISTQLASTAALRNVKRASKQLDGMEAFATSVDYQGMKDAIRTAPLAEVRKNAFALVKGAGEEGPVLDGYKAFIASLEALDTTCNLALRGREIPSLQLVEKFDSTTLTLADFIKVAQASVEVPEVGESDAT